MGRHIFKEEKTRTVVNEITHTLTQLKEKPGVQVIVGTDSQNKKKFTHYVTVIAFRYGIRGVHFIFTKHKVPRIRDRWSRLFREAELSVEIAEKLKANSITVSKIELDYNSDQQFGSHSVLAAGRGFCQGMGYNTNCKPDEQIAVKAADHLLRH